MTEKKRVGAERYTQAQYEALPVKNPDCIYFTTDTNRIYLGAKLFAEGGLTFTNTGEGWRVDKADGTRFYHVDNDQIVDADDHVLVVNRDTLDELVHNDFMLGPTWKTVFSHKTERMTYWDDSRLIVDTTGGQGRISVDLIIETDDPKRPLITHGIWHLGKDLGPGVHEFPMAKWELMEKEWRIVVYSKTQWPAKQILWQWGKMGGFSTVIGLTYDPKDNCVKLVGREGYVLSELRTIVSHDDSITGVGSQDNPLKVVNHKYMNETLNVESIRFDSRETSEISVTIVSGSPDGKKVVKEYSLISDDVLFSKSGDSIFMEIPESTLKTYHDDTLVGDGTASSTLKVAHPLVKVGNDLAITTEKGAFAFSDNNVKFVPSKVGLKGNKCPMCKKCGLCGWAKVDETIKVKSIDLTEAVDDKTVKFKDGKLSSETFVYWDGEKSPMKFKRDITQVGYDQLVTDQKVSRDTIYYTVDTKRIYVGDLLYTVDYVPGDDIPIMYESRWVPTYPQWKPATFYETDTIRMYDEKPYRCLESHMAGNNFIPKKWTDFEMPAETVVRRLINEGPNDFQIAFMKHVPKYPLNDGWMVEHTFNFKVVADPDDPNNPRGVAQFLVDNEVITFKPGDYVRTDGTDQTVRGIKDFKGDARVLDEPPTPQSAINQGYFLSVLEEKLSELWKAKADLNELIRVDKTLKNKSDKWYATFDEGDVGDLEVDDRVYIVRFPENPDIDKYSSITFYDPDREGTYGLKNHTYRIFVLIGDEEIEIFNDGTETWAPSFERDGVIYDQGRREVKFYTVLTVKAKEDDWKEAWGSKEVSALTPGLPVVDCRYNYELIQDLTAFVENLEAQLVSEIERAVTREDELETMILKEIADREEAVEELWVALREEVERAISEEMRIDRESQERDRKLKDYVDAETARAKGEEARIEEESKERDKRLKKELTDEITRVEDESKQRDEKETTERKEDVAKLVAKVKDLYDVKLDKTEFEKLGKVVVDAEWEEVEEYVSSELVLKRTDVTDWSEDEVRLRIYNSDSSIVVEKTDEGIDIRQYNISPDLPDKPLGTEPGRYILKLTKDMNSPSFTWLPVTQDMYAIPGQDECLPVAMRRGTFPRPDRDGKFALSYIRGIDGFEEGFYWMPVRDDLNHDLGMPIWTELDNRGMPTPQYPSDLYGKWGLVVHVKGNRHMLVWEDIVDSLYITEKKNPLILPELPLGEGDWVLAFSRHGTNETVYWAPADREIPHR